MFSRGNGAWSAPRNPFGDEVRCLAAALRGYGLGEGASAAVLGSEGFGTLRAGLAVMATGATLIPLDPALPDAALRKVMGSTGAVHAIASDERQLARVLALRPDLTALDLVLLGAAAPSERKPAAMLVESAIDVGRVSLVDNPDQLRGALTPGKGGTACLVVDSGGETRPVARATLQIVVDAVKQICGAVRGKTVLSSLPVAGIARIAASLAVLSQGATLLLPDPNERPDAGLDLHPADRVIFDVTSLDRLFRAWAEDIEAKSWLGRSVTRWSLRQGRSAQGRGWKHRLAEGLALRGLRAKLGGRAPGIDVFSEGGRRASDEVNAFFAASGLSVRYASPVAGTLLAR